MAHVNLLPWRESLRQQQKKNYLSMLLAIGLMILALVWLVGMGIDQLITNQNQRNQYLDSQIAVLDGQIKQIKDIKERKKAIEQRMSLIEQLQTSRNVAAVVLDELVTLVPPGISFREFKRIGNQLEIQGVSESNNRLAEFMRRLDKSEVFVKGELSSIVADASAANAVSDFKLTFSISPQIAPEFVQVEEGK